MGAHAEHHPAAGAVPCGDRRGDGAQVAGGSGVMSDLEGGQRYAGVPAREYRAAGAIHIGMQRLPDIMKQLKAMESRLKALEAGGA